MGLPQPTQTPGKRQKMLGNGDTGQESFR